MNSSALAISVKNEIVRSAKSGLREITRIADVHGDAVVIEVLRELSSQEHIALLRETDLSTTKSISSFLDPDALARAIVMEPLSWKKREIEENPLVILSDLHQRMLTILFDDDTVVEDRKYYVMESLIESDIGMMIAFVCVIGADMGILPSNTDWEETQYMEYSDRIWEILSLGAKDGIAHLARGWYHRYHVSGKGEIITSLLMEDLLKEIHDLALSQVVKRSVEISSQDVEDIFLPL